MLGEIQGQWDRGLVRLGSTPAEEKMQASRMLLRQAHGSVHSRGDCGGPAAVWGMTLGCQPCAQSTNGDEEAGLVMQLLQWWFF